MLVAAAAVFFTYVLRGRKDEAYRPETLGAEHWARKVDHPDTKTRCEALATLSQSPSAETVAIFVRKLDDPSPPVVAAAARALASHPEKSLVARKAVMPLMKKLDDPENTPTMIEFAAIKALEKIGDPRALPALRKHVTARNPLAADAAWAIAGLKDPRTGRIPAEAEDALIEYLGSQRPRIVLGAIFGLRDAGTERALGALRKLAAAPFANFPKALLNRTLPEFGKPQPAMIGNPCREAIKAIQARTKAGQGGRQ